MIYRNATVFIDGAFKKCDFGVKGGRFELGCGDGGADSAGSAGDGGCG